MCQVLELAETLRMQNVLWISKMSRLCRSKPYCLNSFKRAYSVLRGGNGTINDVPYESSIHKTKKSSTPNAKLPSEADVVVIGAGSVGCSTAYHLSKLYGSKVVLLEKDKITSGTTWHTAGM